MPKHTVKERAKRKKVASPTGRPSRISSGNADAMRKFEAGKPTGGKRPVVKKTVKVRPTGALLSTQKKTVKAKKPPLTRAQRMDRGMSLAPVKKRGK